MKPLNFKLKHENSSDFSIFSPNRSIQKSTDRKAVFSHENHFDLPIVFFEKPQKNNHWNEIAYNILRSVHSENSFQKTSSLSIRKKRLFEKEILSPILSEITSFQAKAQGLCEKHEEIPPFHVKTMKTPRKTGFLERKNPKIMENFSMNLEENDEENSPDISKFLNGFKDYCRRKSCCGELFGKPTKFEVFTDRIKQNFSTQFQKKKTQFIPFHLGKIFAF